MLQVKLGKKRAKRNLKLAALSSLTRKAILPPPPAIITWLDRTTKRDDWSMFANNLVGDCTIAAAANLLRIWSTVAERAPIILTDQEVIDAYSAVSGYVPGNEASDQGAAIADVLAYWKQKGIGGDLLGASVTIDPLDLDQVKDAIAWFGGIDIGLNLPMTAQGQLDAGKPWDVVGDAATAEQWGGHSVCVGSYSSNPDVFYCVTWGAVQPMTGNFLRSFCDEAYACISPQWIREKSQLAPSQLSFATLLKDAGYLAHT